MSHPMFLFLFRPVQSMCRTNRSTVSGYFSGWALHDLVAGKLVDVSLIAAYGTLCNFHL